MFGNNVPKDENGTVKRKDSLNTVPKSELHIRVIGIELWIIK